MPNYSQITIVGHVCKTPELKQANSGNNYTAFSVAVNSGFGDKKQTSFFDVVFFGKQAETICRFVQKGSCLLVDGTPTIEKYTDKDGNQRNAFKITGKNFAFMSGKENAESNEQPTQSYTREQFEAEKKQVNGNVTQQVNEFFGGQQVNNNDDLPF